MPEIIQTLKLESDPSTSVYPNIKAENIPSFTITTDKLANSVITASKIASSAVTSAKIASSAVTSAKIDSDAVTVDKIASNAVTTSKIADDAVTSEKIAKSSITTEKIQDASISTDKIEDKAVTRAKINYDGLTASDILDHFDFYLFIQYLQVNRLYVRLFSAYGSTFQELQYCVYQEELHYRYYDPSRDDFITDKVIDQTGYVTFVNTHRIKSVMVY